MKDGHGRNKIIMHKSVAIKTQKAASFLDGFHENSCVSIQIRSANIQKFTSKFTFTLNFECL